MSSIGRLQTPDRAWTRVRQIHRARLALREAKRLRERECDFWEPFFLGRLQTDPCRRRLDRPPPELEAHDVEIRRSSRCLLRVHVGLQSGPARDSEAAHWQFPHAVRSPSPPPPPQPRPFPPVEFTEITVGQSVTGIVPASTLGCIGYPEWPCVYFHVTAPTDGTLTVELNYRPETQPPGKFGSQGVDVSIVDEFGGEMWPTPPHQPRLVPASLQGRARVSHRALVRVRRARV